MGCLWNEVTHDQGSSALDYLAVIALVAAIGTGLFAIGLPATIAGEVKAQICKVIGETGCEVTQPQAGPDPYEPKQDCWTDVTDRTVEGALMVDTPWKVAVRAGHRVTMTTRRVLHPDGTVTWDVIVSPNVEAGVSTPGIPGDVDPLVWAVLQGTAGRIYSFNASDFGGNESKAKGAAQKFADKLWIDQAQNDALAVTKGMPVIGGLVNAPGAEDMLKNGGNWLVEKTSPVTKYLPFIGDNIERATKAPSRDVNLPDQSFIEGGPSVGFNLDWAAIPGKLSFWAAGRGFANAGVRINNGSEKYRKNWYFKLNGEGDAAFNLSVDAFAPKAAKKGTGDKGPDVKGGGDRKNVGGADKGDISGFESYVNRLEEAMSKATGQPVTLPASTKSHLQAIWPMAGLDIKGKAARMHILSTDSKNNPTQLRTITEWQWIFSWRALAGVDELLGKHRKGGIPGKRDHNIGVGFVQDAIMGRKYLTQSLLDLDGPQNAQNMTETDAFMRHMGGNVLTNPAEGVLDFTNLSPEAKRFAQYIDQNGQTYRQIYDSDATTYVGFGKTIRGQRYVRMLPVFEPETNKLVGAEYLNPQQGWRPWAHCTR